VFLLTVMIHSTSETPILIYLYLLAHAQSDVDHG